MVLWTSWVRTAVHSTLGSCPVTSPSIRGRPRSSPGTTTTRFWRGCAPRIRSTSCGPGFWVVTRYEDIRDLSRDPRRFCSGRGALVNDPIRTSADADAGAARSCTWTRPSTRPSAGWSTGASRHGPGRVGGVHPQERRAAPRRRRGARRDRLRRRAGGPVPPHGHRRAAGDRRGGPAGLPPLVRCRHRVPRPTPDETMAALGELAGFIVEHIRAKRDATGGRPRVAARGQRGRRVPAQQGRAVHVPPDPPGGRQRDDAHAAVGDGPGLARAPGPAGRCWQGTPTSLPGAVEECLRWVTPVHAFCRTATEDISGGDADRAGRLPVPALCLGQPGRADLRGGRSAIRRAGAPPTRCISRSASGSTSAWEPAWPGWRPGSSWRSCWRAFPLTP